MTDKPKPLTREEWETCKPYPLLDDRLVATLGQLFEKVERFERYRERTRGYLTPKFDPDADTIAAEEGID